MAHPQPHIVVFSSLFPSDRQPAAGLFIRERMFRVARQLPLCVVSPVPWFPFQALLRRWRPAFRPGAARHETQQGLDVWFPRFFSVPGVGRRWDSVFMALGAWPRLRRLKREGRLDLIDAHFAYPDGHAATLLGRWLGVPVTITLRGTETRHAADPALGPRLATALQQASLVFAVSDSLRQVAIGAGLAGDRVQVVGNGVDLSKFAPQPKALARVALDLEPEAPVLISVGGLVERKGFHRVINILPALVKSYPDLVYLIVGGPSPEGDMTEQLQQQVKIMGLSRHVRFLGTLRPEQLAGPLSAADAFVLSTRNEGWANVFLEAMACGLPVITTRVGGNAEVVCSDNLGIIVPFGDAEALTQALQAALGRRWDRQAIRGYAEDNTWDRRVEALTTQFRRLTGRVSVEPAPAQATDMREC
jgi:glycosyltransferase involved in cell wall biosynthesis